MDYPLFKPEDPWSGSSVRAVIDIGTNTVLLAVAEVDGESIRILHEEERFPRLGKGVDASGNLSADRMEAVIMVLHEYRMLLLDKFENVPCVVTATSAVRDAANRTEFMWLTEEATGYRIRLLSGEEESRCAWLGVLALLEEGADKAGLLTVDIGGGSTELSWMDRGGELRGFSVNMGSVRFTERFRGKPDGEILCRQEVRLLLKPEISKIPEHCSMMIGVAGTAIAAGKLTGNAEVVGAGDVMHLSQLLWKMEDRKILELNPALLKGREDIVAAGLVILSEIMETLSVKELHISRAGVRHGVMLMQLFE